MNTNKLIEFLELKLAQLKKRKTYRDDQDLRFLKELHETIGKDFPLIEVIEPVVEEVLPEYEGPWELWLEAFVEGKENKLNTVKAIHNKLCLGLKEAKKIVDTYPALIMEVSDQYSNAFKEFQHELLGYGAITSLRKPVKNYSLTITGVHHWGDKQMIMDILTYQVGIKDYVGLKVHDFTSKLPLVVLTSEDEDRVEQLYNFLREKGAIIHKLII